MCERCNLSRLFFAFSFLISSVAFANIGYVLADSARQGKTFGQRGLHGWTDNFVGDQLAGYRPTVEQLDSKVVKKQKNLRFAFENLSSDNFYYIEKTYSGMQPGVKYFLTGNIAYETDIAVNCEVVTKDDLRQNAHFKIGATAQKPNVQSIDLITGTVKKYIYQFFTNLDHGSTPSFPGLDSVVLDRIGYFSEEPVLCGKTKTRQVQMALTPGDELVVTADHTGTIHVVLGLHMYSESAIDISFDEISIEFSPVGGAINERFTPGFFKTL